ncbi:MAG: glutamate--tRNA ligase [Candidatus Marinimicrobia bacterium]|nr:glutamate--tRNA ligase [Candidatus Neomarinimicrobiota bacterium]
MSEIKVRFAPSPTGYLHVGGLRTALFNFLYAKKVGGKFVLRIEDTDQKRKVEGATENLLSTFDKIGISFDEGPTQGGENGPYFQSQRLEIYKNHIKKLLDDGNAYPCFCSSERLEQIRTEKMAKKETPKYDRHCLNLSKSEAQERMKHEPFVIRMKIPDDEEIVFFDVVRGRVAIPTAEIDDQVLIKTDGFPTYHFANVVDDFLMGISHVIRGEEWLPSTPKHTLLYRFLGWKLPKFVHLPLLLNPDKSKLSKRQGDVAVEDYLKKGYLPEALLNFVALLGWNPGDNQEIFSLAELEQKFSLKRVQKGGAVFDIEKLKWMNGQWIRNEKIEKIAELGKPYFLEANLDISDNRKFLAVIENARKRVDTIPEMLEHSLPFYRDLEFSETDLELLKSESSQKVVKFWAEKLAEKTNWSEPEIKNLVKETIEETGIKGKDLFFPLRLALFGATQGPDIPALIEILGVAESVKRLKI